MARLHPQVDVRSAGDLLMRAGFTLPVADIETLDVRYRDFGRLLGDLRGMAASNMLAERRPITRAGGLGGDGVCRHGRSGWPDGRAVQPDLPDWLGPDPSQPLPAKRGSATASLAEALRVPPKQD